MVCACICLSLLCTAVTALPHSNHGDFQCRHTHLSLCLCHKHRNPTCPPPASLWQCPSMLYFWYLPVRLPFIWDVIFVITYSSSCCLFTAGLSLSFFLYLSTSHPAASHILRAALQSVCRCPRSSCLTLGAADQKHPSRHASKDWLDLEETPYINWVDDTPSIIQK